MAWVLYDFDADELATTNIYHDRADAVEDAEELDNVIVIELPLEDPEVEDRVEEDLPPDDVEVEEIS